MTSEWNNDYSHIGAPILYTVAKNYLIVFSLTYWLIIFLAGQENNIFFIRAGGVGGAEGVSFG